MLNRSFLIAVTAMIVVGTGTSDSLGTIFGLKSLATTNFPTSAPTHLFTLEEETSVFNDLGVLTQNGTQIDADGLALSNRFGLLGFRIDGSGSTLISIDQNNVSASTVGVSLSGRVIRGAVFDSSDRLWVVDQFNNELLRVNPQTGSVVGNPVGLTINNITLNVAMPSDIAIGHDGSFILSTYVGNTDSTNFYGLDPVTGDLTFLNNDGPNVGIAGLAFSPDASPNDLFAYDQQTEDDLFLYDLGNAFSRTTLVGDIIPVFNSGGGDLASLTVPEPTTLGIFIVGGLALLRRCRVV